MHSHSVRQALFLFAVKGAAVSQFCDIHATVIQWRNTEIRIKRALQIYFLSTDSLTSLKSFFLDFS